ncbi:MAG: hypothetical protein PVH00_03820 [Gemmatimonadota bacterium]|jgi:hypothetical protein
MDWDGIGTFALFLSSGAIGLGIVALRAYKARLASKLELARIERANGGTDETREQLQNLEAEVRRLTDRVDFTERLLGDGEDRKDAGA